MTNFKERVLIVDFLLDNLGFREDLSRQLAERAGTLCVAGRDGGFLGDRFLSAIEAAGNYLVKVKLKNLSGLLACSGLAVNSRLGGYRILRIHLSVSWMGAATSVCWGSHS